MKQNSGTSEKINSSVIKALNILEYLNEQGSPQTIASICSALSLNRITCTNLVKTLITKKYVYRNEKGRICLTGKIYVMGKIYKEGFPIVETFNTQAEAVAAEVGIDCHLVTLAGLNQGILLSECPKKSLFADEQNLSVPLYCTGAGKVLLANQSEDTIESIISSLELVPLTPNTITDKHVLLKELETIRTQGYGIDFQEFKPGLCCVSAPVYNKDGTITTAVSLTHLDLKTPEDAQKYISIVKDLASALSRASGYRNIKISSL